MQAGKPLSVSSAQVWATASDTGGARWEPEALGDSAGWFGQDRSSESLIHEQIAILDKYEVPLEQAVSSSLTDANIHTNIHMNKMHLR